MLKAAVVRLGLECAKQGPQDGLAGVAIAAVESWLEKGTATAEAACKAAMNSIFRPDPTPEIYRAYGAAWVAAAVCSYPYDRQGLLPVAISCVNNALAHSFTHNYVSNRLVIALKEDAF